VCWGGYPEHFSHPNAHTKGYLDIEYYRAKFTANPMCIPIEQAFCSRAWCSLR
jgi:hypothetical protein